MTEKPLTPQERFSNLCNELAESAFDDNTPLSKQERAEAIELRTKLVEFAKAYGAWLDAGRPLWGEKAVEKNRAFRRGMETLGPPAICCEVAALASIIRSALQDGRHRLGNANQLRLKGGHVLILRLRFKRFFAQCIDQVPHCLQAFGLFFGITGAGRFWGNLFFLARAFTVRHWVHRETGRLVFQSLLRKNLLELAGDSFSRRVVYLHIDIQHLANLGRRMIFKQKVEHI